MNKINLSGISPAVIVRAIMTLIVAVNIIFGYLGWRLIPTTEADIKPLVDAVVVLVTTAVWAWGWWKNNSITENAQAADNFLYVLNKNGTGEQLQLPID